MIYVMSDIHGNRRRFDSVMRQINLQPEDTLYVIGDVIDRHPDGIPILLELMAMPNVVMLLGNHEYMMLETVDPFRHYSPELYSANRELWFRNGGKVTFLAYRALDWPTKANILKYLNALPLTKVIVAGHKRYKLVHAAPPEMYVFSWEYPCEKEYCIWERVSMEQPLPKGYTFIFGHTPTQYFKTNDKRNDAAKPEPMSILHGDHRICIDCGSGYPDKYDRRYGAMGRLACLRLDDLKEFYSEETIDDQGGTH